MATDAPNDALAETLDRLAAFLPRLSGRLTVDGPLGRITVEALHDSVVVDLAELPDLASLRALFARPPGPEKAAPPTAEAAPKSSKRKAASKARERTRALAAALDAAGLTVEIRVAGEALAMAGRRADPGVVTRALGLGRVDLSGRTAFKLARDLLA